MSGAIAAEIEVIMQTLLEMSLSGAVMIGVIIIVRALAVNRLPKTAFLALWGAAFCCLILPMRIPSPISVYSAIRRRGDFPMPVRNWQRTGLLLTGNVAREASVPSLSPWLLLWIGGAVLLALIFLILHLRGRRVYAASLPVEQPFAKSWIEEHRLRRPVQVRYSDRIESPLTYGILWPVILLPADMDWKEEETAGFILAHEMSHIRRFDALTKWLLAAMLCIHWFNPLVWVMYILSNRDLELACDESVIRQYGMQSCPSYALALLEMEEKRTYLTPLSSSFSKNALKERIDAIMKAKKRTAAGIIGALVIVAAVVVIFATSAIEKQSEAARKNLLENLPVKNAGETADRDDGEENSKELPADMDYVWNVWDSWKEEGYSEDYTQEQYDQLMSMVKPEAYEGMSIAEFNRTINRIMEDDEYGGSSIYELYDTVVSNIQETDPNAGYLRNTIPASMEEYQSRVQEVYSGKRKDPSFSASAEKITTEDVFGDSVEAGQIWLDYEFTYRILDQDNLTVGERDAFLQKVMQTARDLLEADEVKSAAQEDMKEMLQAAGEKLSNDKISFTGCEVYNFEVYRLSES